MIASGIFRQYDIRGIYGKDLTVEAAEAIGRAYPLIMAERGVQGAVAVGRDNRPSGRALRDALVKGLTAGGVDVIDVGEVPTPLLYWSLHHLPVAAGIQITGSHNPPEYNGFKCCIGTGSLHGEGITRLRDLITAGAFPTGQGTVRHEAIVDRYVTDIVERIGPLPRDLKVVIDCGNGAGAIVAPQLFRALGVQATMLFAESDGTFPNHHPDPTVEANLQDLIAAVRQTGSQLGIGFDGDADRIGLVDQDGTIVWGDYLLLLYARDVLARMLRNLKEIHARQRDPLRLVAVLDRLVVLLPDHWGERRDRGMAWASAGDAERAVADLQAYLDHAADASDAPVVAERLASLKRELSGRGA